LLAWDVHTVAYAVVHAAAHADVHADVHSAVHTVVHTNVHNVVHTVVHAAVHAVTADNDHLAVSSYVAQCLLTLNCVSSILCLPTDLDGSAQNKADVSAFEHVLKQCSGGTIVVVDIGSGTSPCTRAWCLYGAQ
jgi:hypothetical protein